MRIGLIGKGGVGKSVIAGTLARIAARSGARVLAFDSDPVPGISWTLGSGPDPVVPLLLGATRQDERGYWSWREGFDPVSAMLECSTLAPDGVRLLQRAKLAAEERPDSIGATKAFVEIGRGILNAPALADWMIVGDLPAGPRQLAEGWAPYVRTWVVVAEPSTQSTLAARRVARIARQASEADLVFVANRVCEAADTSYVEERLGEPVIASVPLDVELGAAERLGLAPLDRAPGSPAITAIARLLAALQARARERPGV